MSLLGATAVRVGIATVLLVGGAHGPAGAEEELLKDGGQYLGWQVQKTTFLTCDKDVIQVGTGKVQRSIRKCAGQGRGPFAFFDGKVEFVDPANSTVRIEDVKGRSRDLFVPLGSYEAVWTLQKGDKVSVSEGPVPGRAELIQKLEH